MSKNKNKLNLEPFQINKCLETFKLFDINNNKRIEPKNMKIILEQMGYKPTEEELYKMIYEVNENSNGYITEDDFVKIIDRQKKLLDEQLENEIFDAYIALGGDVDKKKSIDLNIIKQIWIDDFQMKIDLDTLIQEVDKDNNEDIDYEELKALLSN